MYWSESESRYTSQDHLKGGVSPSRHALARHRYLERQKEWARQGTSATLTANLKTNLLSLTAGITGLFVRIATFLSHNRTAKR